MAQSTNPKLSYEALRSFVLEVLAVQRNLQFGTASSTVSDLVSARDIGYDKTDSTQRTQLLENVNEILWDLIIEGVLRPGLGDGMNSDLPFLHVTERGKTVVGGQPETPYDPDRYLARLQQDILGLDDVILVHLEECLRTFRIDCLLSSAVMLGCAAEKAMEILINAYERSLSDGPRKKFQNVTRRRMIKAKFDELQKRLPGEPDLTGDLKEGLETALAGIFQLIRAQRNDAGHPTGTRIVREHLYSSIVVFPNYLRKVYSLIEWLNTKDAAGSRLNEAAS